MTDIHIPPTRGIPLFSPAEVRDMVAKEKAARYQEMTEEELVERAEDGDPEAEELLRELAGCRQADALRDEQLESEP